MSDTPLLLLASQSPARAKLLTDSGIGFTQLSSHVDEDAVTAASGAVEPGEIAVTLARAKCEAVAALPQAKNRLVIGCDSVFAFDGEVHGKPLSPERATERISAMRGRTGHLHTGHWLIDTRPLDHGGTGFAGGLEAGADVTFTQMTDDDVAAYVSTGEPLWVAGSFTLDGYGAAFIERVEGDLHAVIGLSVNGLRLLAQEADVTVSQLWESGGAAG
ncbi:Maf family protein [Kocuria sp.]|uniref:Maf family protein n=1 Tax=Kocuria sp. TaxID=1871328 RepID=UPI0026DF1399|nr:nucleoside triphosphate pyrophosphatase [Kocuria sp.]MDO5619111.1 nucleoside triphosphate pyrophosphatase [Kocuria sp.]